MASPAALSILVGTFREGPDRNRALGVFGAVGGSAAAVGVIVAGLVLTSIHTFRLLGPQSENALGVLTLVAIASVVISVRRNRPQHAAPWSASRRS